MVEQQYLVVYEQFDRDHASLTRLRPVWDLRCGGLTQVERIVDHYDGASLGFQCRDYLEPVFRKRLRDTFNLDNPIVNQFDSLEDTILFVDGAVFQPSSEMPGLGGDNEIGVMREQPNKSEPARDRIVYFRLTEGKLKELYGKAKGNFDQLLEILYSEDVGVPKKQVEDVTVLSHPWNLIEHNEAATVADYDGRYIGRTNVPGSISQLVSFWNNDGWGGDPKKREYLSTKILDKLSQIPVYFGKDVVIHPFVELDFTDGPIIVEDGVEIMGHTTIKGPTFMGGKNHIGKEGFVKERSVIVGSSFGPCCRVAGEIEESIFQDHVNNQHAVGYIGHSYVCPWVNLGAGTITSDLLNNYGDVKVKLEVKRQVDSGESRIVGSSVGDYSKLAIGLNLNTGTVIDPFVITGPGHVPPKYVPAFVWFLNGYHTRGFGKKKLIETAEKAMRRRGVEITQEDRDLFDKLFELTKEERDTLIKRDRMRFSKSGI